MPSEPIDTAFMDRLLAAYDDGTADREFPAEAPLARSLLPGATSRARDFWSMSSELPEFLPGSCLGCMECVTQCPDTAILARVVPEPRVDEVCAAEPDPDLRAFAKSLWARPKKYADNLEKQGKVPGRFGIFVDPRKCKGCMECVTVCGHRAALRMTAKTPDLRRRYDAAMRIFRSVGDTPREYLIEKSPMDMMLAQPALDGYCGGAGSCMGCGEGTVLRMMLAATEHQHGSGKAGLVAATGCNTVYTSTYPHNPYRVPWTNSLFENACAVAMGVRLAWDREGGKERRLWVIGGDGALFDIGFQSLSRLLTSRMDIKVLVLDTQVYSNTGGQASTASFIGQETKYSAFGSRHQGKVEARKELGAIAMMHPDSFVAQTTAAHPNHFYKAVMAANQYPGAALVIAYTSCQPEHGIGDDRSHDQAELAVQSRAFPLMIYDPSKGPRIKDRLDLTGNPAPKEDWWTRPKTGEVIDFIAYARTEGRFARHFGKDGTPTAALMAARDERLANWHWLQELAGLR